MNRTTNRALPCRKLAELPADISEAAGKKNSMKDRTSAVNCCGCPFCILKGTEQIESVLSIEGFIWYNSMNYSVKEKRV